jgi:hypothetical protein
MLLCGAAIEKYRYDLIPRQSSNCWDIPSTRSGLACFNLRAKVAVNLELHLLRVGLFEDADSERHERVVQVYVKSTD